MGSKNKFNNILTKSVKRDILRFKLGHKNLLKTSDFRRHLKEYLNLAGHEDILLGDVDRWMKSFDWIINSKIDPPGKLGTVLVQEVKAERLMKQGPVSSNTRSRSKMNNNSSSSSAETEDEEEEEEEDEEDEEQSTPITPQVVKSLRDPVVGQLSQNSVTMASTSSSNDDSNTDQEEDLFSPVVVPKPQPPLLVQEELPPVPEYQPEVIEIGRRTAPSTATASNNTTAPNPAPISSALVPASGRSLPSLPSFEEIFLDRPLGPLFPRAASSSAAAAASSSVVAVASTASAGTLELAPFSDYLQQIGRGRGSLISPYPVYPDPIASLVSHILAWRRENPNFTGDMGQNSGMALAWNGGMQQSLGPPPQQNFNNYQ